MKCPNRNLSDKAGARGVAAAAQWNGCGEQVRSLRDEVPRSEAAHGLSGNIDPGSVDVEFFFNRGQHLEDCWKIRLPRSAMGLRCQDKRRMVCLNLARNPRVCAAQARSGDLLEIVGADASRPVQPNYERILASFVVSRRDEQPIRHRLVRSRLEAIDRFLREENK